MKRWYLFLLLACLGIFLAPEVKAQSPVQVLGTLTTTCANANTACPQGDGSTVQISTSNYDVVGLSVKGTYAGVTVNFEITDDGGTTWYSVLCARSDMPSMPEASDMVSDNSTLYWNCPTSAAANGMYRVRASGIDSGAVKVTLTSAKISAVLTGLGGGGGGGGGGISGTVSSPFVPFASGPDALSDTAWEYGQDAGKDLDCYMDNNCQIEITGSGGNADFFSPGGFNINDTGGQNGLSYFGGGFSTLTIGNNGGRGAQIVMHDATSGSPILQASGSTLAIPTGLMSLGENGATGGSLTLNDATMGSFALATDTANPVGAALEFTNVNTVGTGALDMSIFPDGMVTDVAWSAPGTMAPFVGWFIGPTTVKTIADIVDVNTTTLNPDTTGFPCGPMGLGDGQIAHFSDGDTNVWGAILSGGGAFLVLAYCNGTNWTVIGK